MQACLAHSQLVLMSYALLRVERALVVLLATSIPIKFLTWLSSKMYPQSTDGRYIYRLSPHIAMKTSDWLRPAEATVMQYLEGNTNIPVPAVYKVWSLPSGGAAFLMQWYGSAHSTLADHWDELSPSDRTAVALQIRGFIEELRDVPQPSGLKGRVCQFDGSACWGERMKGQYCGPFNSEQAFNDYRLSLLDIYRWEPGTRLQIDQLSAQLRFDHRIVLTHGDLSAKNILLDDQNNVVALLDWEMAGWRPGYWEYIRSVHGRWEETEWRLVAGNMVPAYEKEMEIDDQFLIINGAPF